MVVLATIRLIVIISEALFPRNSATADDARSEIRDYGVDLIGGQLAGRWLKVIRRCAQWPPVTRINGVCTILEGGHSRTDAATTDRRLQRLVIEFCRPQICSNRIIVVLLIAICEGTVAIRASRGFPRPQAALTLLSFCAREAAGGSATAIAMTSRTADPIQAYFLHFALNIIAISQLPQKPSQAVAPLSSRTIDLGQLSCLTTGLALPRSRPDLAIKNFFPLLQSPPGCRRHLSPVERL